MKFWKSFKSGSGSIVNPFGTLDRRKQDGHPQQGQGRAEARNSSSSNYTPLSIRRRRSNTSSIASTTVSVTRGESPATVSGSIYEEFSPGLTSPLEIGSTFVELIKRHGTHLGVIVSASPEREPRIIDLVPGSWAQRSDVLCIGDVIVSVNGYDASALTQGGLVQMLDESDRIQLEVQYRLPPSSTAHLRVPRGSKLIQVTLKKDNGSFGMVIRGGVHDIHRKSRPFTVVHVTPNGPAFLDGTIRSGDRLITINGQDLRRNKLPELQAMLYQQDGETVFGIEYGVALHPNCPPGPVLVEMRREVGDILGFGLNRCDESGQIFIESIKQASLSDRCGALHVGDILHGVNGVNVALLDIDQVTELIRGDPTSASIIRLEIEPGAYSRNLIGCRSSVPSPRLPHLNSEMTPGTRRTLQCPNSVQPNRKCTRYRSMSEIDRYIFPSQPLHPAPTLGRERRKFVTFTVELQKDGGPLGLTLATEGNADVPGPIYISSLLEDGLAHRSRTVQKNDQLVEVNGRSVQSKCLNEVLPMVQNSGDIVKLKLARLISIPERDFVLRRSSQLQENYGAARKPPLPSPSPCRSSPMTKSPTPSLNGTCVSLLPAGNRHGRPVPVEVHKVTLFKDNVYEDFGFSLSDGLYEKGIFINRIRKGGPADTSGMLRPLDRILQINETRTHDFDCCLAVPLIAAAGDRIELLATRPTRLPFDNPGTTGSLERLTFDTNQSRRLSESDGQLQTGGDDVSCNTSTIRANSRTRSPRCSSVGSVSQGSNTTAGVNWQDLDGASDYPSLPKPSQNEALGQKSSYS